MALFLLILTSVLLIAAVAFDLGLRIGRGADGARRTGAAKPALSATPPPQIRPAHANGFARHGELE